MKTQCKRIYSKITFTLMLFVLFTSVIAAGELEFEVGFSPEGDALQVILDAINAADESIHVAAYSFTSAPIAEALLDAHKRGVSVKVVADEGRRRSENRYTVLTFLANQGVPVRINDQYGIFHHKFMIIDKRHLETGSFNYSKAAAERNAENVLLLYNVPDITNRYLNEWQYLWDEAETLKPRY